MWLAVYVALSRVRKLANFRSVGLTDKIRTVIGGGPPDSIPSQFEKYFAEKERRTKRDAARYMRNLAWKVFLAMLRSACEPFFRTSRCVLLLLPTASPH